MYKILTAHDQKESWSEHQSLILDDLAIILHQSVALKMKDYKYQNVNSSKLNSLILSYLEVAPPYAMTAIGLQII